MSIQMSVDGFIGEHCYIGWSPVPVFYSNRRAT
jgi:hypothetical protein